MTASADNSDRATQPVDAEHSQPSFPSQSSAGDETNKSLAGSAGSGASLTAASGQRIRDYELLELLGQGGMGSVWKAKHTRLKKFVALKLLPQEKTADEAAVARFHREMEAVGALKHPHIIEALDAGEENGTHYLVMEYVAGIELAELSKKVGPFPIADACELMRQTALGLQHAFEHGLVHRDIKPSNLMLSVVSGQSSVANTSTHNGPRATDNEHILKILDLGLALLHGDQPGAELTSTGQVMGTLDYIAPEQLADTHAVDIRADLYSLGCTLFRLLTTEPPFAGPSLNTAAKKMFAHSFTPAPKLLDRRPDVPAELSALVARLLEKKPDARFATPIEVATALAPFCVGHNLSALLANSSAPSSASDPFASTVVPNVAVIAPRDEPSVIDLPPTTDRVGWVESSRPTTPAPSPGGSRASTHPTATADAPPNASRATEPLTVEHVSNVPFTEHVENVLHVSRRRPLVIVAAILAIVLLSVFLPPFLKRDASLTETTTTNPGEPGGVSPRTIPNTTDVRGLTPPGSPSSKSEISNSKSQIPADPDRAAAEWVLRRTGIVWVDVETLHDAMRHHLTKSEDLPKEPFRVVSVTLAGATDVDVAGIQQHLGTLKSLRYIELAESHRIDDEAMGILSQLPALVGVNCDNTKITAEGVLTLLKARPLISLRIDGRQFTKKVADRLERSTTQVGLGLIEVGDEQLRQAFRLVQIKLLSIGNLPIGVSRLRPSTWMRLVDAMPQLTDLTLDRTGLDDADAAMLSRLPNLEVLQLIRQPGLTDAALASFATLPKLRHINFTASPNVTPMGLADFLESHPACQVVWDGVDHRAVAEWVLSVGGKVQVAGRGAEWLANNDPRSVENPATGLAPVVQRPLHHSNETPAESPDKSKSEVVQRPLNHPDERGGGRAFGNGPVLLTGVDLSGLATLKDADLARLADCTTLRDLQLHNSSLTGGCLTHLKALAKATQLQHDAPASGRLAPDVPASGGSSRDPDHSKPNTDHSLARRAGLESGPRLRVLSLAGLPIEDQHLAALSELKQLQTLYLHNTKITDAGMPALAGLTELIQLTLKDTPISSVGLESLKRLPKLVSLVLISTAAESRAVEVLCEFPSLVDVNLSNTRVTEADVKRLAQRPLPWHGLYLSNLPTVTDAILTDLRGQRELITLELGGTSVTPAAFDKFVREHPRLGMTQPTDESAAPDLRVAHRVLAAGGSVNIQIATPQLAVPLSARVAFDASRGVQRIEDLPKEPFRIWQIDLRPAGVKVTDAALAEVGRLEMLSHFNTTDANITDRIVLEVAAAPQLDLLYLVGTKLSPDTVRQLATRTGLTSLYLLDAGLDGPTAASLVALTKLKNLDLSASTLTDDDIAFVEKLTDLEALSIARTQVVNHGWARIAKLPKLKHLQGYNMPVTDEALRHAGQIESLEYLSVAGGASEVSDAGLQHLRPLRHLRELGISHCQRITDAGLAALAELPALQTLHLNATPITDAGLKHLAKIKTLKSLNLTECKLSEAALDDLQDTLPWCRILRP